MIKQQTFVFAQAGMCPICGAAMVKRKGAFGEFYGCSKYPRCKGNRKIENIQPVQQAPVQNVQPQPQQRPVANPLVPARENKLWYLATLLADGSPVVIAKNEQGWEYQKEDGTAGVFPLVGIANLVKSVTGPGGEKISHKSPQWLFKKFREVNGGQGANAPMGEQEDPNKVKGRIPEDKISQYQKQIEVSFNDTQSNIMINALAGTGKTTVLKHIASFMKPGEQWLYLVFNKKNQLESQGKFPEGVTVMTSHGFLGQVLKTNGEDHQTLPNTKYIFQERVPGVKGNEKKIDLILDEVMDEHANVNIPANLRYSASFIVKNIVSLCKAYSVNPYSAEAFQKIVEVIRSYDINTKIVDPDKQGKGWGGEAIELRDYTQELAEAALEVLNFSIPGRCNKPELNYVRDFDDTLWFTAINPNVVWPHYDVVLADEVQDFNECQSIMLKKLSEAGARVVAVGDPNQSIYRFRGSDSQSFEKVSQSIQAAPNGGLVHELPTNYRSGKNIINFVRENTHVKNLQAGLNFDGEVTKGRDKDEAIGSIIGEIKNGGNLKMPTAIIGRTNAPLAKTAIELMKNNIDFVIIGKDFSKDLTDFVYKSTKKAKRNRFDGNYLANLNVQRLSGVIRSYAGEYERANGQIPSKAGEIKENNSMTDLMDEVLGFLAQDGYQDRKTNTRVNTAQDFIHYLKNKFSGINEEEEDPMAGKDPLRFITLTSAHKSKGLEYDRVLILEPNLFPHPKAKTPEDLAQEENAKYVAFTRAMKELHVLKPSEDKKGKREAVSKKPAKKAKSKGWYKKAKAMSKKARK